MFKPILIVLINMSEIMKYTVIAPVGDNMAALFVGIRDFPTEKIILVTPPKRAKEAEKTKQDLTKFSIPCQIIEIKGNIWEETFKKISEIKEIEKDKNIIINTATGSSSASSSARAGSNLSW